VRTLQVLASLLMAPTTTPAGRGHFSELRSFWDEGCNGVYAACNSETLVVVAELHFSGRHCLSSRARLWPCGLCLAICLLLKPMLSPKLNPVRPPVEPRAASPVAVCEYAAAGESRESAKSTVIIRIVVPSELDDLGDDLDWRQRS
jgi:hypothetical protein